MAVSLEVELPCEPRQQALECHPLVGAEVGKQRVFDRRRKAAGLFENALALIGEAKWQATRRRCGA